MQVSSMRWVSVFKGGRVGVQFTLGARRRQFFFFSFSPFDVFFIYLFNYFFHKDVYKCFPLIIFLNINAHKKTHTTTNAL